MDMAYRHNTLPVQTTMVDHQQHSHIHQDPTPATPYYSQRYNGHSGRVTGLIQLCCAIGMLLVGVAQLLLRSIIGFFALGIWGSLLFYGPAGILGIVSFRKRKKLISAYLAMSILSALSACATMILSIIPVIIGDVDCYISPGFSIPCESRRSEARKTSEAILAVMGFIELIVATWASTYCYTALCSNNELSSSSQEFDVNYLVNHSHRMMESTPQHGMAYRSHTDQPATTFTSNPHQQTNLEQTYPTHHINSHQQTYPNQQAFPHQPTNLQTYLQQQAYPYTFQQQEPSSQTFPRQHTHPQQTYPQQTYPQQTYPHHQTVQHQPSNPPSNQRQQTQQQAQSQIFPLQHTYLQQQLHQQIPDHGTLPQEQI